MDDFLKHIQFNKEALDADALPIFNWNEEKHALIEINNKDEVKDFMQSHRNLLDTDLPPQLFNNTISIAKKRGKSFSSIIRMAAAACVIAFAMFGAFKWFDNSIDTVPKDPGVLANNIPNNPVSATPVTTNKPDKIDDNNNEVSIENNLVAELPTVIKPTAGIKMKQIIVKQNNNPQINIPQTNENASLASFNQISNGYKDVINIQLDKLSHTPIYTNDKDMFGVFKQQFKQLENEETNLKNNIKKFGFNDTYLQEYINISQYKLKVLQQLQTEIQKTNLQKKQAGNIVDSLNINYITL